MKLIVPFIGLVVALGCAGRRAVAPEGPVEQAPASHEERGSQAPSPVPAPAPALVVFDCLCEFPARHGGGFGRLGSNGKRKVPSSAFICAEMGCDGSLLCEAEGRRLNQEYIKFSADMTKADAGKEVEVFISCVVTRGPSTMEEAAREQFDPTANPCLPERDRHCPSSSERSTSP
jgi:hypothetical protein